MKKLVSVLLVLVLLCCTTALAESFDPKQLSLDELVEMRKLITAEINERLAETDGMFFPADYTVGKHIPAGCYLVTCTEVLNDENYGRVAVWAAGKSNWDCHIVEDLKASEIILVDLVEGDTLRIRNSTITIMPYILPSF